MMPTRRERGCRHFFVFFVRRYPTCAHAQFGPILTSVIGSIVSGGVQAGAAVAGGAATTAVAATAGGAAVASTDMAKSDDAGPMGYFVDSLFRRDLTAAPGAVANSAPTTTIPAAEVSRIFMTTVRTGAMAADDVRYVGQIVAQRTGLTQQEAEKRVTDTVTRMQTKLRETETAAREAADKARKASATAALWLFISLLVGAFVASLGATYGGRSRDA